MKTLAKLFPSLVSLLLAAGYFFQIVPPPPPHVVAATAVLLIGWVWFLDTLIPGH